MELNQIRYFILAAQLQNVSKAARALNVTQPTLSKSISKLEEELGVSLFDRSAKKLTLNENGSIFLKNAVLSVQELENAVAAVKNHLTFPSLSLGLFHFSDEFMRCLGDFSAAFPNVVFHIERLETASENIDTNRFDMLLYPRSTLFAKYRGAAIYTDSYCLAAHKSNAAARLESVRFGDLRGQKFVFIKHGDKQYEPPYHLCKNAEIDVSGSILTNSGEVRRWLIARNHAVGFVSRGCAEAYAADSDIALIPVAEEGFGIDVMLGFKRDKHLSDTGRTFAAFVRERFGI